MTTLFTRRRLCLLLLFTSPLCGFWLGEELRPLISATASGALVLISFGAALAAPSTVRKEKNYVLLAAAIMFVCAWLAGYNLTKRAIGDCLQRGEEIQSALESHLAAHGSYPQKLEELGIPLPGQRRLHAPLLRYQPRGEDYRLYFRAGELLIEATRYTSFMAHRRN